MLKRPWLKAMAFVGKTLVNWGNRLRRGLVDDNAARAVAIADAVERFKQVKLAK